jgi:hypothetical protein
MMNVAFQQVIAATDDERRDLLLETARRLGTAVQNVEKDFWVCWTLDALFNGPSSAASTPVDNLLPGEGVEPSLRVVVTGCSVQMRGRDDVAGLVDDDLHTHLGLLRVEHESTSA